MLSGNVTQGNADATTGIASDQQRQAGFIDDEADAVFQFNLSYLPIHGLRCFCDVSVLGCFESRFVDIPTHFCCVSGTYISTSSILRLSLSKIVTQFTVW